MSRINSKTVDILRDLAVRYELIDLEIAYDLMNIAYKARPNGLFIQRKLDMYKSKLNYQVPGKIKLNKLVKDGSVAIIPIGFRCHTKKKISELLGIAQPSLPFDSGFFPPFAVANVINDPLISMNFSDRKSQTVCIKYENHNDSALGLGVKFQKSTYDEINSLATSKNLKDINMYLDSTFGYYTLDLKHKFVLAHYNWHKFSDPEKSKCCTDPELNLNNINAVLNKRIERMFNMCLNAKHVFFIFQRSGGYNYMCIDDNFFDLHDLDCIKLAVKKRFKAQSFVITDNEISNAENLLKMIL